MNYIKADPQGNITAIVTDPSDPKDRIRIASGIMGKDRTVEQVAFVTDPENGSDISIEMAENSAETRHSLLPLYFF